MDEKENVLRSVVGLGAAEDKNMNRGSIHEMAEIRLLETKELSARKMIYPGMQQREVLNAFREIRTKLLQQSPKDNFVLLVSSICAEGGASFVSVNMAISFALAENKTALVIDCNLYDPSISDLLVADPDYGLTDYLEDPELDIDDIIYSSGIPRLRVIPVGGKRESATEFFTGERMRQFINSVKKRYPDRYIILDVAPLSASTDARILVDVCDYAVLVVPGGKTTESQILAGVDAVSRDKLAGIVFNN
jgi:exopolysaccharide/PEP-CTERM locus tyrosine autokinase